MSSKNEIKTKGVEKYENHTKIFFYVRERRDREEGNCYVHEKFAISISEL